MSKLCSECEGNGYIECPYCGAADTYMCDNCGGTGEIDEDPEENDE